MAQICPQCKMELEKPDKTWKYGRFLVQAYRCANCGTQVREYTKDGIHSFTLQATKGTFGRLTKV